MGEIEEIEAVELWGKQKKSSEMRNISLRRTREKEKV